LWPLKKSPSACRTSSSAWSTCFWLSWKNTALPEQARLNVFDINGKQVDSIELKAHQESFRWDGRRMPKGQYLIKLVNLKGEELSRQKVILQ